MKRVILIFLLLTGGFQLLKAQLSDAAIDWKVKDLEAPDPQALARLLVKDLQTEREKVRAVYSWIAQNISYNTGILPGGRIYSRYPVYEPEDTSTWGSAVEMTAMRVMKRRLAICDGYSKLFKALCDYAGLRSEVITGYARSNMDREERFRTNHSWNAVMIDSSWFLVDVTWGSGYVSYGNQFVQKLDERYFLAAPQVFIQDHYPEDLKWTLLDQPPSMREYRRGPFRFKTFVKYNVSSYSPGSGILEAARGDTIRIVLELKDIKKAKTISPDPFSDSTTRDRSFATISLEPVMQRGNKIYYQFICGEEAPFYLQLVFNDDLMLRYRLELKKEQRPAIALVQD